MSTATSQANPYVSDLPDMYAGSTAPSSEREIFHELMNQLTAINLCTWRLRLSSEPLELTMLERIVESAVTTARRLEAEMNR